MILWETGWGGRARLFQKINNCLKEQFIYLYIHNSLERKNPFHYSGQHSICMYRHWSSRQISHPPPSDSGFGRETLSKINQDSRRSYSPPAKNNNIIFPKPCENKAVSRSSLHGKKAFQMLPREECSRGSCCSMPECHRKRSAERKRGWEIHERSQLLQSWGQSAEECWEHPGEPSHSHSWIQICLPRHHMSTCGRKQVSQSQLFPSISAPIWYPLNLGKKNPNKSICFFPVRVLILSKA